MYRLTAAALAMGLSAAPLAAQDADTGFREGLSLLEEGTRLLLEGLVDEIEPALKGFAEGLEGLNAYHPPEVLPNGDIIIRRKQGEDLTPAPEADEIEI